MIGSTAEHYLEEYVREYGERNIKKVIKAVRNEKRFHTFIEVCIENRVLPTSKDFFACVMNKISWSFAKKTKVIAAVLILLARWDEEVNFEHNLASNSELEMFSIHLIEIGNSLGI